MFLRAVRQIVLHCFCGSVALKTFRQSDLSSAAPNIQQTHYCEISSTRKRESNDYWLRLRRQRDIQLRGTAQVCRPN